MVPMWMFPVAIACGNAFVLKPSEKDPSASILLAQLWAEAGLPDGVFNVVHGDKVAVDALLDAPRRRARSSFVGSTPIARYVYETGTKARQAGAGPRRGEEPHGRPARRRPRPGRRRGGLGRLRLRGRALHGDLRRWSRSTRSATSSSPRSRTGSRKLVVGPGSDGRSEMGPLVTARAPRQGRLLPGLGRRPGRHPGRSTAAAHPVTGGGAGEANADGFWLGPSLLDHVTPAMAAYRDEIFGPVLAVIRGQVLRATRSDLVNDEPVRQRRGDLHQRRRRRPPVRRPSARSAWWASTCRSRCRWPTTPSAAGRRRLFGDTHVHGTEGVHFYTHGKVVTSRWLDPSHGGVNLGFPVNS